MRIAIFTFHAAYNCGAMLQAWALKVVLEQLGHTVDFPWCERKYGKVARFKPLLFHKNPIKLIRSLVFRLVYNAGSLGIEDLARYRYRQFLRNHLLPNGRSNLKRSIGDYDLYLFGSDQIWNPKLTEGDLELFLGESLPTEVPRIAYAASIGDSACVLADEIIQQRFRQALGSFLAVSVRESLAKTQLSNILSIPIEVMPDPTLLLVAEDYRRLSASFTPSHKPYLYVYTLFISPSIVNISKQLAARLNLDCIITPVYQFTRYRAPFGLTYAVSPDRLITYMQNATCVIAASFHGTVFSLIHRKPFVSWRESVGKEESRSEALLRNFKLEDRLVTPSTSMEAMAALLRTPLPNDITARQRALRDKGLEFLIKNIECAGRTNEQ